MRLILKKGYIQLTSAIRLVFERGELLLEEKESIDIKVESKPLPDAVQTLDEIADEIVPQATPAPMQELQTADPATTLTGKKIGDDILILLKKHKTITVKEFIKLLCEKYPNVNNNSLGNKLWHMKNAGEVITVSSGTYSIGSAEPIMETNKEQEAVQAMPPPPAVKATEEKKQAQDPETSPHYYPEGFKPVCMLDVVKIKPRFESVKDEDILEFPEELENRKGTIMRIEDGADSVTVQIKETGRVILAYPHWLTFISRNKN